MARATPTQSQARGYGQFSKSDQNLPLLWGKKRAAICSGLTELRTNVHMCMMLTVLCNEHAVHVSNNIQFFVVSTMTAQSPIFGWTWSSCRSDVNDHSRTPTVVTPASELTTSNPLLQSFQIRPTCDCFTSIVILIGASTLPRPVWQIRILWLPRFRQYRSSYPSSWLRDPTNGFNRQKHRLPCVGVTKQTTIVLHGKLGTVSIDRLTCFHVDSGLQDQTTAPASDSPQTKPHLPSTSTSPSNTPAAAQGQPHTPTAIVRQSRSGRVIRLSVKLRDAWLTPLGGTL